MAAPDMDLHALLAQQRQRWQEHTPILVEALLEQQPALGQEKEALLDLINHEIVLRCEFDQPPAQQEYLDRFPALQDELRMLFEVQEALERDAATGNLSSALDGADDSSRATVVQDTAVGREHAWPRLPNYEIDALLGQGGMGVVYKAHDRRLKRPVALKMIRGGLAGEEVRRRFQSEAEAVARLDHPGIVHIYEIGESAGEPFFALEYIAGGVLSEHLHGVPQAPLATARLVETLARAVHYAHGLGIIHRDLKPANILLQKVGVSSSQLGASAPWVHEGMAYLPKIADFGLAKQVQNNSAATQTQAIVGTPSYMAPEQAGAFGRRIGPATDVYALGAILYEMITGRPPFAGATVLDTLDQVRTQDPVPPTRLQPRAPRDLETICLKCLRKDPAQRYASAEELADDLGRFLRHEPIRARPTSLGQLAVMWCRRRPAWALLIVVMFAGTFFGIPLVTYLWRQAVTEKAHWQTQFYDTRINLGQRHWREAHAGRLQALLESLRPGPGESDLRDFEWYYLQGLLHKDLARVPAQACLAYSPDGVLLAAGSKQDIHLWKTADLEAGGAPLPFAILHGHTADVISLAFNRTGDRLLSAGQDRTVQWWDVAQQKLLKVVLTHPADVTAVAYSPAGNGLMASACKDGVVRLWDADGSLRLQLDEHEGQVNDLAFSADGLRLVSGGKDRCVLVWDVASGEVLHRLTHDSEVLGVAVTPDLQQPRIAAVCWDCRVHLWDAVKGTLLHDYPPMPQLTQRLAFRPDGKRLACACWDRVLCIWNTDPSLKGFPVEPLLLHKGHFDRVDAVAFAPRGKYLASVSKDRTLRIWEADQPEESRGWELATIGNSLALSPSQPVVAIAGNDKNLHLWNWRTSQDKVLPGHAGAVIGVAFAGDGTLASAGWDGKMRIWDINEGKMLREFAGNGKPITALEFHPGGHRLVSGGEDGVVFFWDAAAGRKLFAGPAHQKAVNDLAYGAAGRWLASAGMDGIVFVSRAEDGQEIHRLSDPGRTPLALGFSSDGALLAAGDLEGSIRIWDTRSGERRRLLEGHEGKVQAVVFSRNGRRLATGSSDGTVKLWDLTTGLELLTLRGHGRDVNGVVFAENDTMLISLGRAPALQGQIRVWDTAPGRK